MKVNTIGELLAVLQELVDEHGEDMPLRVATQPSYPLVVEVDNVRELDGQVWIACSGSAPYGENPYAQSAAWKEQ